MSRSPPEYHSRLLPSNGEVLAIAVILVAFFGAIGLMFWNALT